MYVQYEYALFFFTFYLLFPFVYLSIYLSIHFRKWLIEVLGNILTFAVNICTCLRFNIVKDFYCKGNQHICSYTTVLVIHPMEDKKGNDKKKSIIKTNSYYLKNCIIVDKIRFMKNVKQSESCQSFFCNPYAWYKEYKKEEMNKQNTKKLNTSFASEILLLNTEDVAIWNKKYIDHNDEVNVYSEWWLELKW